MDTLNERQKFCLEQRAKYPNITDLNNGKWLEDHPNNIHGQVIFAAHGFGYEKINGEWLLIPHSGKIVIEKNVTIHSLTTVVRGTGDNDVTFIGEGTKIDTLCHIAHNVKIGKNCLITSGVTIGGSAVIEDDVYIGIGAVIRNKIRIGNGAVIGMGAVVVSDVAEGVTVMGNPAKEKGK